MKKNIIDKATDDNTKIVMTNKSIKWIIGILSFGVMGILGFAWGLYVTVSSELDQTKIDINNNMTENQKAVMQELSDLKDGQVKLNEIKNHDQDLDIVRLLERTDSRNNSINGNSDRPTNPNTTNQPIELPNMSNN